MDEKRGISLRKKRTVKNKGISAPKQISAPVLHSHNGVAVDRLPNTTANPRVGRPELPAGAAAPAPPQPRPRERTPQNDRTADLVKRRYSTRFADVPRLQDFQNGVPPVPGLPSIPSQFKTQAPPAKKGDSRINVDLKALRDPKLRPDEYVAAVLADASEEDIFNYQQDLRKIKNRADTDMQHNVYQNRTQFIRISKEAEKLKGEMRTLRSLMTELTSTLSQTASASASNGEMLSRKASNRSSVANLEAMWNTHLQMLWKKVEGSQKYLPAIPGRHVIYESGKWVELNAATWKARRRVHMILLNDHLLVAAEKRRTDQQQQQQQQQQQSRDKRQQNQPQAELTALRCFALQDIQIADITTKSGEGKGNAINVRSGTESFTFSTGSSMDAEKTTFLMHFRKAGEELRRQTEAETEERAKARDSLNYLATRDASILQRQGLLESLPDGTSRSSFMIDVDGKQQSLRWVESQVDDLDVDIALQRFEEAVGKVERLRRIANGIKNNPIAKEVVTVKIDERAGKLATSLSSALVETHAWQTATRQNVEWLVRLGYEDRAREAYLEARSSIIKKRTRQCIFDGDLHAYIYQISFIYFTIIRNTTATYQTCFPGPMTSACVAWAKRHVDDFNVVLARQLSSVDRESVTYQECVERAKQHAGMLGEVGLDFANLIGVEDY